MNCTTGGPPTGGRRRSWKFKKSHRQQTLEARYLTDQDPMSLYRFIAAERGHCPVRRRCQVWTCRPSVTIPSRRASSGRWDRKRRPRKRHWSRLFGIINAAMARVGCRSCCARTGIEWAVSACARLCSGGASSRCNPRPIPRAPPIRPMACAAPPTGCSTSPSPPRPIRCGCQTSRICCLPMAAGSYPVGPIYAPFRPCKPSTWSAGTWPPSCPKNSEVIG